MNIRTALRNDRLCASLTGLRVSEFNDLSKRFQLELFEYENKRVVDRIRKLEAEEVATLKVLKRSFFTF